MENVILKYEKIPHHKIKEIGKYAPVMTYCAKLLILCNWHAD